MRNIELYADGLRESGFSVRVVLEADTGGGNVKVSSEQNAESGARADERIP